MSISLKKRRMGELARSIMVRAGDLQTTLNTVEGAASEFPVEALEELDDAADDIRMDLTKLQDILAEEFKKHDPGPAKTEG